MIFASFSLSFKKVSLKELHMVLFHIYDIQKKNEEANGCQALETGDKNMTPRDGRKEIYEVICVFCTQTMAVII